jgi:hypothetical protein
MAHGPYDPATQFLLDTMHDPSVSLWRRIEIAKFLIETQPHEFNVRWVQDPEAPMITIIIGGIAAGETPARCHTGDTDHIADNPRLN